MTRRKSAEHKVKNAQFELLHPRDKAGRFTKSGTRRMSADDARRTRDVVHGFKGQKFASRDEGHSALREEVWHGRRGLHAYLADWRTINDRLRRGEDHGNVATIDADMRPLKRDYVLSRQVPAGQFGRDDVDLAHLEGLKMRDAAYAPTNALGGQPPQAGMVNMTIAAPAGTHAMVDEVSGEVLLARNTSLAVTKVTRNDAGGWDVHAVVVPGDDNRASAPVPPSGTGRFDAPEAQARDQARREAATSAFDESNAILADLGAGRDISGRKANDVNRLVAAGYVARDAQGRHSLTDEGRRSAAAGAPAAAASDQLDVRSVDQGHLDNVAGMAVNRQLPPPMRLDTYETLSTDDISALNLEQRRAVLDDLAFMLNTRPERAARVAALRERFAQAANGGDAAAGRAVLDRLTDKQLETLARDHIPNGALLPTSEIKNRALVDPELMDAARAIPDSEIRPKTAAVQAMAPVQWSYGSGKTTGKLPKGQRAAIDAAIGEYATHTGVDGADGAHLAEPPVNAALRGSIPLNDAHRAQAEALDAALEVSPLQGPVTAYRGLLDSRFLGGDGSLVGKKWTDPAFVSATASEASGETYTGAPGQGLLMQMQLPAGFKAVAIRDDEHGLDDEGELVLPRGSTFTVTADHGVVDGFHRVDVRVDAPERPPAIQAPGVPQSRVAQDAAAAVEARAAAARQAKAEHQIGLFDVAAAKGDVHEDQGTFLDLAGSWNDHDSAPAAAAAERMPEGRAAAAPPAPTGGGGRGGEDEEQGGAFAAMAGAWGTGNAGATPGDRVPDAPELAAAAPTVPVTRAEVPVVGTDPGVARAISGESLMYPKRLAKLPKVARDGYPHDASGMPFGGIGPDGTVTTPDGKTIGKVVDQAETGRRSAGWVRVKTDVEPAMRIAGSEPGGRSISVYRPDGLSKLEGDVMDKPGQGVAIQQGNSETRDRISKARAAADEHGGEPVEARALHAGDDVLAPAANGYSSPSKVKSVHRSGVVTFTNGERVSPSVPVVRLPSAAAEKRARYNDLQGQVSAYGASFSGNDHVKLNAYERLTDDEWAGLNDIDQANALGNLQKIANNGRDTEAGRRAQGLLARFGGDANPAVAKPTSRSATPARAAAPAAPASMWPSDEDASRSASRAADLPAGGPRAAEIASAGAALNSGGRLNLDDPAQLRLHEAIRVWTTQDAQSGELGGLDQLRSEVRSAFQGKGKPTSHGAILAAATATAPPDAPELFRGVNGVDPAKIPDVGGTYALRQFIGKRDVGPSVSSFTTDQATARSFAGPLSRDGVSLDIKVRAGARGLRIEQEAGQRFERQQEWLSSGNFRVVGRSERMEQKPFPHRVVSLELEQIGNGPAPAGGRRRVPAAAKEQLIRREGALEALAGGPEQPAPQRDRMDALINHGLGAGVGPGKPVPKNPVQGPSAELARGMSDEQLVAARGEVNSVDRQVIDREISRRKSAARRKAAAEAAEAESRARFKRAHDAILNSGHQGVQPVQAHETPPDHQLDRQAEGTLRNMARSAPGSPLATAANAALVRRGLRPEDGTTPQPMERTATATPDVTRSGPVASRQQTPAPAPAPAPGKRLTKAQQRAEFDAQLTRDHAAILRGGHDVKPIQAHETPPDHEMDRQAEGTLRNMAKSAPGSPMATAANAALMRRGLRPEGETTSQAMERLAKGTAKPDFTHSELVSNQPDVTPARRTESDAQVGKVVSGRGAWNELLAMPAKDLAGKGGATRAETAEERAAVEARTRAVTEASTGAAQASRARSNAALVAGQQQHSEAAELAGNQARRDAEDELRFAEAHYERARQQHGVGSPQEQAAARRLQAAEDADADPDLEDKAAAAYDAADRADAARLQDLNQHREPEVRHSPAQTKAIAMAGTERTLPSRPPEERIAAYGGMTQAEFDALPESTKTRIREDLDQMQYHRASGRDSMGARYSGAAPYAGRAKAMLQKLDSGRLGAQAPAAPTPPSRRTAAANWDAVRAATSLADARNQLDGLTIKQLLEIAEHGQVGFSPSWKKSKLRDHIVEMGAGRRLDAEAIARRRG
ncbi:ADP-ribosyltransferase [Dactylosporangium sp. CS-033363]|uniref:ADP-ribosyltransferase n=1 Tax=Dactylosporangium sp. CS-033363 TaxID=3239935 RepID=UPI003D8F20F2